MFNSSRKEEEKFERNEKGTNLKRRISQNFLKNQSRILFLVFFAFIFLLLSNILLPLIDKSYSDIGEKTIDRYLSLLSTWIGAVIGFYFGKDMSDYLFNKLEEIRGKAPTLEKDYESLKERYLKLLEERDETGIKFKSLTENLRKEYSQLLDEYENDAKKFQKLLSNFKGLISEVRQTRDKKKADNTYKDLERGLDNLMEELKKRKNQI